MGRNFGVEVMTPRPRKSILTEPRRLTQKRWRYSQKCVLQSCASSQQKNIKKVKKTFEHDISPICRGGPSGPIFTVFGVLGHTADVITYVKFQVDRSKGLGSTCTQSWVFPIDFDRRPYNSVIYALPCYTL